MIWLVLANSWEYYYFGNHYKKQRVPTMPCHYD